MYRFAFSKEWAGPVLPVYNVSSAPWFSREPPGLAESSWFTAMEGQLMEELK